MRKVDEETSLRICALCESATPLHLTDRMVCKYRGVVCESYGCHRFSYDPLKREPKMAPRPELTYVPFSAESEEK